MSVAVELTQPALELLHQTRLRGMVKDPAEEPAAELTDAGYTARRGDSLALTSAGRAAHAAWARVPAGSEAETAVRRAYDGSLEIDLGVKSLTTEWQRVRAAAGRNGLDVTAWKLVDRLGSVHARACGTVLGPLARAEPRFAGYRGRLRGALDKLEEGEVEWFSGLQCDSYHTVWWQLHEDLLLALGISRSDDPNQ